MLKFITLIKIFIQGILILFICFSDIYAQDNVGIGTTTPDATAILDLTATNKGLLIPRMTTVQRNSILSPAIGLIIYNTTDGGFQYYTGSVWLQLFTSSSLPLANSKIYVGNNLGFAAEQAMTGDAAISNTGLLTIGNGVISTSKIADNAVDGSKINLAGNAVGDMMYYNGTDWIVITPGTNGYILKTSGALTAPSWANPTSLETDPKVGSLTQNYIPRWGTTALINGIIFDNGTNIGIGDITPLSLFTVGANDAFQVNSSGAIAAATGITSSGTVTFSGLSSVGIVKNSAAGVLSTGTVNLALSSNVSGILPIANGGTGISTTPSAGRVIYSDGTSFNSTAVGSSGQMLISNGTSAPGWVNPPTGTVTSVGLALPVEFNISNSPVIGSGTLTGAWASQTQNLVFASPSGTSGTPVFRSLDANDIPSLNASKITTGILPIANGGTNLSTIPTNGQLLIGNGTNYTLATLTAGSNISVTNGAGTITIASSFSEVDAVIGNEVTDATLNGGLVRSGAGTIGSPYTLGVNFSGSGSANTVARSDHNHSALYEPLLTKNNLTSTDIDVTGGTGAVIGTGTSLSIANNAIITTKIADNAVDGSKINISGNVTGDLMYYNGTDWIRLGIGTNNQILTSNGTIPGWQPTPSGLIPSGTDKQTLRYNGTTLETTDNLKNDGTNISIGIALASAAAKLHQDGGNATATYHKFTAGTTTGQTASDGFDVGIDAGGNAILNQNDSLYMSFKTNNTERMRISAKGGKVGIGYFGTIADSLILHIANGDVLIDGDLNVTGTIDPIAIQLVPQSSAPVNAGTKGFIYYDNNTNSLKMTDGVSFTELGSQIKSNLDLKNTDNTAKELKFYEPSTSGSNFTSFKAQPQAGDVTYTLPPADGANGQILKTDGSGNLGWMNAGGSGTVTSVGISLPTSVFTNGSAVTAAGNLSATFNSQSANNVFAAPDGSAGIPTFRGLVLNDLPNIDGTKIELANNVNGDLMYYNGTDWVRLGVGSTNQVLTSNGTIPGWAAAATLPSGSTDQTLRYNGSAWIANTTLTANATGQLTIGDATNIGTIVLNDANGGQKLSLQSANLAANSTYTIPDVGATSNFVMSEGAQTINGIKTFTDSLVIKGSTARDIRLYDDTGNKYAGFKAPAAITTNATYSLPPADGVNGTALTTNGTGTLSWTSIVPTGSMMMWPTATAPSGWVLCDGSSLLRTGTYAALFAVIGTTYGSVDGTHFNVPDLRGRFPLGSDNMGGTSANRVVATQADNLGQGSGEENHVLTTTEIPSHNHNINARTTGGSTSTVAGNIFVGAQATIYSTSASNTTMNANVISNTGSGGAHNNMPPYMTINFIIKY